MGLGLNGLSLRTLAARTWQFTGCQNKGPFWSTQQTLLLKDGNGAKPTFLRKHTVRSRMMLMQSSDDGSSLSQADLVSARASFRKLTPDLRRIRQTTGAGTWRGSTADWKVKTT